MLPEKEYLLSKLSRSKAREFINRDRLGEGIEVDLQKRPVLKIICLSLIFYMFCR